MHHRSRHQRQRIAPRGFALCACLFAFALAAAAPTVGARQLNSYERERGRQMLKTLKEDIKKHYYDPNFRGIDLEERFRQADEMLKQAQSNGQVLGIIAQALVSFNDSHLFFIPPQRPARTDYGWGMQMLGDRCYVSFVKPGSDAEKKGLREGDLVHLVSGMKPTREDLWKIKYLLYSLRPQTGMTVVVERPGGGPREVDVLAKVTELKRVVDLTNPNEYMRLLIDEQRAARLTRHRFAAVGEELFVWKMPQFDLPKEKVDAVADKFRKHKAVIIDLRGNGGGYQETLLRLVGNFFDRDVKLGDSVRRKETKPLVARTAGDRVYHGKLIVLVDSESGSSSEIFARVVQLEKRGTVIGDRSAGAVMGAYHYSHQVGIDTVTLYGASVTVEDLLMTDGKSLEHAGVTPDEVRLPTPADMAARRDPVLAHAASLLGVPLTPEKAGAMFPVEWEK